MKRAGTNLGNLVVGGDMPNWDERLKAPNLDDTINKLKLLAVNFICFSELSCLKFPQQELEGPALLHVATTTQDLMQMTQEVLPEKSFGTRCLRCNLGCGQSNCWNQTSHRPLIDQA
jgi:hypothetical protein